MLPVNYEISNVSPPPPPPSFHFGHWIFCCSKIENGSGMGNEMKVEEAEEEEEEEEEDEVKMVGKMKRHR